MSTEHLNDTINTHKSENERLHTLTQQLHKNLEHFQAMTAKQHQQEQLTLHEEKSKLEHQIKSLTDKLYKTQQACEQEMRQNITLSDQLKIRTHQIEVQKDEASKQQKNQAALQQQLHGLTSERQTLSALLDREKTYSKSLQQRYDTMLKSNARLKKQKSKNKTPA